MALPYEWLVENQSQLRVGWTMAQDGLWAVTMLSRLAVAGARPGAGTGNGWAGRYYGNTRPLV